MNVGELQRRLSQKAERVPTHRFGDLYNLLYDKDWLRLAGSKGQWRPIG
jgi:hypothetical protein